MVYSLLLSFFIKDSSNPLLNIKIKETNALFLTKRWGGGGREEKQYKKELDIDMIEVDCRKKAKYFPITLTCKPARRETHKHFWNKENTNDIYVLKNIWN